MTRRLTAEDEIREAGARRAREWVRDGWRMPEATADRIAEALLPVRDVSACGVEAMAAVLAACGPPPTEDQAGRLRGLLPPADVTEVEDRDAA